MVRFIRMENLILELYMAAENGKAAIDTYKQHSAKYLLASAPTLIDDYNPLGETFVGNYTMEQLESFDYEDYRRHQGVRHPHGGCCDRG